MINHKHYFKTTVTQARDEEFLQNNQTSSHVCIQEFLATVPKVKWRKLDLSLLQRQKQK